MSDQMANTVPPPAPLSGSTSASPPQPTSPLATTSLSRPTATATTQAQQPQAEAQTLTQHAPPPSSSATSSRSPLHQTLPTAESQRHVAEARTAVVASMGNMVDAELQSRAAILHSNAVALSRQERDVLAATDALRREREKLAREADGAARKVKELGNVQNWAEVLERGFLVLEETVRLADGGGSEGGSSCSCSCSDCGSRMGEDGPGEDDGDHQGVQREEEDVEMEMDAGVLGSDTSPSLVEAGSSTDTGRTKGSKSESLSTTS